MRHRAAAIGADFKISSAPAAGVQVECLLQRVDEKGS
jgi:signal transduction histidine kinase